jgi:hypothetical protein
MTLSSSSKAGPSVYHEGRESARDRYWTSLPAGSIWPLEGRAYGMNLGVNEN